MALLQKPTTVERSFNITGPLAPAGTFIATCMEVKDRFGITRKKYENPNETEVVDLTAFLFGFKDETGQSYQVPSRDFRISAHEKSSLMHFLHTWLGKVPRYGWDYCEMQGKPALITVEQHVSRTGTPYSIVESISPLPSGFPVDSHVDVPPAPVTGSEEASKE